MPQHSNRPLCCGWSVHGHADNRNTPSMRLIYLAVHDRLFAPPNAAFVGEGCIYLERKTAVRVSDFVVNGYVTRQRKQLISGAVGRSADFLNTSSPENILLAPRQTCSELISDTNPDNISAPSFEKILEDTKQLDAYKSITNETFSKPNRALARAVEPMLEIQAAERTNLTKEVEKAYDNLAANMMDYMREAHAAYSAAIGVTCGEAGGVHLLIGLSYILALNVLFLTFLYFVLFILAFFQVLQIYMLGEMAGGDDDDSVPKC
ncbi:hypothetical protein TSMEX_009608 [Taenia solium]|eukprot:TsM_000229400 transcript=TsM_000229400 gene=TsM_000229400